MQLSITARNYHAGVWVQETRMNVFQPEMSSTPASFLHVPSLSLSNADSFALSHPRRMMANIAWHAHCVRSERHFQVYHKRDLVCLEARQLHGQAKGGQALSMQRGGL